MILSLFAVGAIGFWVALVVLWAVMTWAVEMEKGWGATLTMGAAIRFALLVGKSDILSLPPTIGFGYRGGSDLSGGWNGLGNQCEVVGSQARMKYDELRETLKGTTMASTSAGAEGSLGQIS